MILKIALLFVGYICVLQLAFADEVSNLQNNILPEDNGVLNGFTGTDSTNPQSVLDSILAYIRDSIFGLMALIAIGVFLYIGFKLITARGNPEEFKKALNTFIYAIIGIFIVSFAWAAVKLVAGLNIG